MHSTGLLASSFVNLYFLKFPKDKLLIRLLVYATFTLDTVQTVLIAWDILEVFVYGIGDPAKVDEVWLTWFDLCIIDGLVAFLVQLYFASRIYMLSNSQLFFAYRVCMLPDGTKILVGIIVLTATTQMGAAVASGIASKHLALQSQLRNGAFVENSIWLGSSALCDILIACTLTFVLSQTPVIQKRTQYLIRRIILFTLGTGALTAVVATADLITFLLFPHRGTYALFTFLLGKLYSNSLFVALNSRSRCDNENKRLVVGVEVSMLLTETSRSISNVEIARFNSSVPERETLNMPEATFQYDQR
ncbi:hypothetical protein V5O48_017428, partial [Marasmius crinis-equi]